MAATSMDVTLDGLHDSILSIIRGNFPGLKSVEAYRADHKGLALPACVIEMTALSRQGVEDPGNGQLAMEARFLAHLILDGKAAQARLEVRKLAAAFAAFVHQNRWGTGAGPAQVVTAGPDDVADPDQNECWHVEWTTVLRLGPGDQGDNGKIGQPLFGFAPDIGRAHRSDYRTFPDLAGTAERGQEVLS